MLIWFALCAALFAAGGVAGGLSLACRYAWPQKLYDLLFPARP